MRNGYDLKAERHINPKKEDYKILSIAVSENRMVITMGKDFGELVYNSGLPHSRVLRIIFLFSSMEDFG